MTTVVIIVCLKLALACLQWPALLTRVGSWIVALANLVGRVFVPEREESPIPAARVVREHTR